MSFKNISIFILGLGLLLFIFVTIVGFFFIGLDTEFAGGCNIYITFPTERLSVDWLFFNYWYLFVILAIIIFLLEIEGRNGVVHWKWWGKIKKGQAGFDFAKFYSNSILALGIPLCLALCILGCLRFCNNKLILNSINSTEQVVVNHVKKIGRKSPSYFAVASFCNDSVFFEIQIDYADYSRLMKGDTLELNLFKGFLGLTTVNDYRRVNIPNKFHSKKFSTKEKDICFAASNMHTADNNHLWYGDDIKQYEVQNIHYKKGKYYKEDLYEWNWYAEKSTWEEIKNNCYPPSRGDWQYILKERKNAANLHFLACVEGINGLVLLPNDWDISCINDDNDIPDSLKVTLIMGQMKYSANIFSDAQWGVMQSYGAIFLPAAGYSKVETIEYKNANGEYDTIEKVQNKYENQKGYYWTTTSLEDETKAYCFVFSEDCMGVMKLNKSYHCSIRLLRLD